MAEERDETPEEVVPAPPSSSKPTATPGEDWESRFKYLLADFENFRRRAEREREATTRQTRGALLRELLPIVEAFRSAREFASRDPASDPLRRGFDLLDREWSTFLKHEGVEPVATVGAVFRAEEAEAVGEAEPGEKTPPGTIAEIVQQGYRFFGGLLRPAKVIVARARPPSAAPSDSAPSGETPPEGTS